MVVITLRDYAKEHNISYEAVRKQVVRYADELGDHIIKDGRQQFLDEEAVAFLDAKRQKNPVAIIQQDKNETIEQLRQEKENLLVKIAELSAWKAENAMAIAEANQNKLLLEEGQQKIEALEAQNADLSHENEAQKGKIAEVEKKASDDVQKAETELEKEKKKRAYAEAYAAELAEYIALPFFKRLKAKKPVLKNLEEEDKIIED